MTTTLITGANKGLGYETARRLIGLGHTVYLGARNEDRGRAAAAALGTPFVLIDVTDDASVQRAAEAVRQQAGTLDVLINNAGISGAHKPLTDLAGAEALELLDTNVAGIVRVTNAMLPLMQASGNPVVVNVSSGLGSIPIALDPDRVESATPPLLYSATKAAVTMLSFQYSRALAGMRVNAVDPGYTATDLNGNQGTQSIGEGVIAIVRMATLGPDGPTGTFQDRSGPAQV